MISTFVPCKNEKRETLLATVDSALAVTDEVVICDDGSDLPISVADPRVRVVRHERPKGPAGAANTAARACKGLFLARLDVGDRFYISKREQLLRHLDHNAHATFSLTVDEQSGEPIRIAPTWSTLIWSDNQFAASSTVFSRTLFEAVGGYDETLRYCDDWEFHVRVHAYHRWVPILILTGTATLWSGGHSDVWQNEAKKAIWSENHARAAAKAREHSRSRTS